MSTTLVHFIANVLGEEITIKLNRLIYKLYRTLKLYFLAREPSWFSRHFFKFISVNDIIFSRFFSPSNDYLRDIAWTLRYSSRYSNQSLYNISTDYPLASDSHDHMLPRGSAYDNSVNQRFNYRLFQYFGRADNIRVLDLGCSGGGFVRSLLEDGLEAIGIEGSDFGLRNQSREWKTIPFHLFVADIGKPYTITNQSSEKVLFHCITAWEVLEHIVEPDIYILLDNVRRHLEQDGIFVASIDMTPDGNHDTGAVYHVSLFSREHWIRIFKNSGFEEVLSHCFETQDFVRGHGRGMKDWSPIDGDGFHVVLRRASE